MSCPNCGINFDINDSQSGHQVNDLTELTYCSYQCSKEHMFRPEAIPFILERIDANTPKTDILSAIEAETDASELEVDQLAETIILAAKAN